MSNITMCLRLDGAAEAAADFDASVFPGSRVKAVHRGAAFRHNEAFSFQISTGNQAETDHGWNAITGNGGAETTRNCWTLP